MSADLLREAAQELRERARPATPGPWRYDPTKVNAVDHGEAVFAGERGWGAITIASTGPADHAASMADAAYIATMHPGVGLAVADWLDERARATCPGQWWGEGCSADGVSICLTHGSALRVARAILGRDQ